MNEDQKRLLTRQARLIGAQYKRFLDQATSEVLAAVEQFEISDKSDEDVSDAMVSGLAAASLAKAVAIMSEPLCPVMEKLAPENDEILSQGAVDYLAASNRLKETIALYDSTMKSILEGMREVQGTEGGRR